MQFLDEKEREQVKSKTMLQDIVQEFQTDLKEKGIYCSNS